MEKYFLNRIQKENGVLTDGIEVHDTLDSAKLAYWGRAKLAYGKTAITFMSLKIKDGKGEVVKGFEMAWKAASETENMYFLHHVRLDGTAFDKNIDPYETLELAKADFASHMEYGYGNTKHPDVSYVSCYISDLLSGTLVLEDDTWEKIVEPESEPELAEPAE